MNDKQHPAPRQPGGLTLGDIYHVLFRHKWLILACWIIGFIAAAVIYFVRPTVYTSEATVMIRHIFSNTNPSIAGSEGQTQQVHESPDSLIYGEIFIVTSYDLALRVATNVGPERILAKYGGGDNITAAAGVVHANLTVERVPKSSVLRITFTHRDQALAQTVLEEVIKDYMEMHSTVYVMGGGWENAKRRTDDIHNDLIQTIKDLQEKEKNLQISDIDTARKSCQVSAKDVRMQIWAAQADMAEHKARVAKLKGLIKNESASKAETNSTVEAEIPKELQERYAQNAEFLAELHKQYRDLRSTYSEENNLVKEKQAQIERAEKQKAEMEKQEPRLARQMPAQTLANGQNVGNSLEPEIFNEEKQMDGITAKIIALQSEEALIKSELTNLDAAAPDIRDLEQKRDILDANLRAWETRTENQKIDLDAESQKTDIARLQQPTPAAREFTKTSKMMGVAAFAGILSGLALAFLLELYVDRTIKRPKEIEGELGMRLFVSIPDFGRNGHRRKSVASAKTALLENGEGSEGTLAPAVNGNGGGKMEVAFWDAGHSLHPYSEALRDRLISFFDINNMNHKPKLVAVTGAGKGAGTSTIAAGLAASLSETGDGNVLLVDMNLEHGSAQQFYKGKPGCELDQALEETTRENALIQDKLYVVNGSSKGDNLSRMLPKNFANLVPKLKASDYDYIIFDMPPIARAGVTRRLAMFMDIMLLVVEAEKTSRDVVRQAGAMITESKTPTSVVLNKTRAYVPKWLHQDF